MSDSLAHASGQGMTNFLNQIEEFFRTQDKHANNKKLLGRTSTFLKYIKKENQGDNFISLECDHVVSRRLVQLMNNEEIPYMQFDVKNQNQSMIFIPIEFMARVKELEASILVNAGLEIDTLAELKAGIEINGRGDSLFELKDIDPIIAQRVLDLASKKNVENPDLTIVGKGFSEKELEDAHFDPNLKTSLYCSTRFQEVLKQLYVTATVDLSSNTKSINKVKNTIKYLRQESLEVQKMLNRSIENGVTDRGFIYSLENKTRCIKIEENSFTMIKDGNVMEKITKAQLGEYYNDILKLTVNNMGHPIYMTEEQVQGFDGGKDSVALVEYLKETEDLAENTGIAPTKTNKEVSNFIRNAITNRNDKTINLFNKNIIKEDVNFEAFVDYVKIKDPKTYNIVLQNEDMFRNKFETIRDSMINIQQEVEPIKLPSIEQKIKEVDNTPANKHKELYKIVGENMIDKTEKLTKETTITQETEINERGQAKTTESREDATY